MNNRVAPDNRERKTFSMLLLPVMFLLFIFITLSAILFVFQSVVIKQFEEAQQVNADLMVQLTTQRIVEQLDQQSHSSQDYQIKQVQMVLSQLMLMKTEEKTELLSGARFTSVDGWSEVLGTPPIEALPETSELVIFSEQTSLPLGELVLTLNSEHYQQIREGSWRKILTLTMLIIFMAFLMLLLFYLMLRPLKQLQIQLKEYDIEEIIKLPSATGVVVSEVRRLRMTINTLLEKFHTSRSKERQVVEILEQRTDELATASKAKDEFLASMSHELRTPLSSIIGNAELIAEKVDTPELKELVRSVEMAGRSQLSLVNDILDMSKIESGKFTIDEHPYNISVLLQDVEHMLATRAHEAGTALIIEQQNREEYLLIGDGQRIGQILINLIGSNGSLPPPLLQLTTV